MKSVVDEVAKIILFLILFPLVILLAWTALCLYAYATAKIVHFMIGIYRTVRNLIAGKGK